MESPTPQNRESTDIPSKQLPLKERKKKQITGPTLDKLGAVSTLRLAMESPITAQVGIGSAFKAAMGPSIAAQTAISFRAAMEPSTTALTRISSEFRAAMEPSTTALTGISSAFGVARSASITEKIGEIESLVRKVEATFDLDGLAKANAAIFKASECIPKALTPYYLQRPITADLERAVEELSSTRLGDAFEALRGLGEPRRLTEIEKLRGAFRIMAVNDLSVLAPSSLRLFATLGSSVHAFAKDFSTIQRSLSAYLSLQKFASSPLQVANLTIASREYFTSGDLLLAGHRNSTKWSEEIDESRRTTRDEIDEWEEKSMEKYLGLVAPKLLSLWQGGIQAARSDNPDKIRHALTSLRELFTHVLHTLAPDDQVKAWSTKGDHFDNGKLTRRARIEFILAPLDTSEFRHFLETDVESALSLVKIFNGGTHGIDKSYNEEQLRAIFRRVAATLGSFIEIRLTRMKS